MLLHRILLHNLPLKLPGTEAKQTSFASAKTRQCRIAAGIAVETPSAKTKLTENRCKDCDGTGKLSLGGYHRKNPLNPAKLLGELVSSCYDIRPSSASVQFLLQQNTLHQQVQSGQPENGFWAGGTLLSLRNARRLWRPTPCLSQLVTQRLRFG